MIIGPHLLKSAVLRRKTNVFLCGPGIGGVNFSIRELARVQLGSVSNVNVHYGEDIESLSTFKRRKRDMQTLEVEFAHSADFTLLILESPGSIAELGTFSMIDNLRGRLVVLVPSQFYRDSSYIARGPLSLLSKNHLSNVIYFDRKEQKTLNERILYPLTFYKFAHHELSYTYQSHLANAFRDKDYQEDSYEKFIGKTRKKYNVSITFAAILILGLPTFPELISSTSLSADETSEALSSLYSDGKVTKLANGRYRPMANFSDPLLRSFNSSAISQARAKFIAQLDDGIAR